MFSSQMDLYCRLPVSREVLVSRPDEVVLLDRLFRAMSPLEATGSDGNRSIWIRLERGGPEDWCPYEEWKEDCAYDSEDTSREAWLDEWKSWNPYECEWYRIWIAEHDGYRCMGVTNSLVVEYDPRPHPVTWATHPEPEGRLVRFFSLLIPEQIFALFDADSELMKAGVTALRIISLGFLVSSVGVIYSGTFEAIGNGRNSLIISLLRQFVITIPLSFLLSKVWGPSGVWLSFPAGELCASITGILLLNHYENGILSPFLRSAKKERQRT